MLLHTYAQHLDCYCTYAVCVPEEDVQTGCFERLVLRQECANGQLIPV